MRLPVLIAALVLSLLASPLFAQDDPNAAPGAAPPGQPSVSGTLAPPFYQGGIRMGTSYCAGSTFDCDSISVSQSEIIDAANQCINARFNISTPIMATYSDRGEFENCVLPQSPSIDARGSREWAVCCVKRNDAGTCELSCTRYIDQKQPQ